MTDPPRILGPVAHRDAADPRAGLKRALLDAARREAPPPPEARRQVLDALGLGVAASELAPDGRRARASEWPSRPHLFSSVLTPDRAGPRHLGASALACAAALAGIAALLLGGARTPLVSVGEPETRVELRASFPRLPGPRLSQRDSQRDPPAAAPGSLSGLPGRSRVRCPLRGEIALPRSMGRAPPPIRPSRRPARLGWRRHRPRRRTRLPGSPRAWPAPRRTARLPDPPRRSSPSERG